MSTVKIYLTNNTIKKVILKNKLGEQLSEIKCDNVKEVFYKDEDDDMITMSNQSDWEIFLKNPSTIYLHKPHNVDIVGQIISKPVEKTAEEELRAYQLKEMNGGIKNGCYAEKNKDVDEFNKKTFIAAIKDNDIDLVNCFLLKKINMPLVDYMEYINSIDMYDLLVKFKHAADYTPVFLDKCVKKCANLRHHNGIENIFTKFKNIIDVNKPLTSDDNLTSQRAIFICICVHKNKFEDQNIKILELLLESGADIDITDSFGDTALHWAVYRGSSKIVDFLLGHGANDKIKNQKDNYAINERSYEDNLTNTTYKEIDEIFNKHEEAKKKIEENEKFCSLWDLTKEQFNSMR